ncbi:hypothetical protein [Muricoccus radiodurans]|uniref:hypothetical protein n=1 Tax=Muricoccus radiodurans TaxID=2231721 RepID=UPI003CEC4D86
MTIIPLPSVRRRTPATPAAREEPGGEALLRTAGAGPEDRVVAIGPGGAETLGAALRRGCRAASGLARPTGHPDPADVVVARGIHSEEDALPVLEAGRRALSDGLRGGRLVLSLLGAGLARRLVARLAERGFTRVQLLPQREGGVLLLCALPAPVRRA